MMASSCGSYNYLQILALLFLLPYDLIAYPIFGTKKYGRSANPMHHGWGVSSMMHVPSYYYQAVPHPQPHYPLSYYDAISPYAQDYMDDYYYPEEALNYPVFYPTVARSNSKYDIYQPAIPYYYNSQHLARPGYGYYDNADAVDKLQDEMIQEEEREQREEALPIGQETWYEAEGSPTNEESIDDVNAAFLQNLMMYNEAISNQNYEKQHLPVDTFPQKYADYDDYSKWNIDNLNQQYRTEDEDVEELKMLAKKPKNQKSKNNKKQNAAQERLQMIEKNNKNQKSSTYDSNNSEAWINYNNKRMLKNSADPIANLALKNQEHGHHGSIRFATNDMSFSARKSQIALPGSTSTPLPTILMTSSTLEPVRDARGGQKEVVLMRPATPVRRPFSEPVMKLLAQQGGPERKRTPSVYDTIKHLLEMEKSLEEKYHERDMPRPAMRKRYVTNEEILVEELSGLKKTA